VKEEFFGKKELKGLIIGGPGPTKYDFVEGDYLPTELKKKVLAVKDLSYTDEFGLQELVDKSQDVLAEEEITEEKKLMGKFFNYLSTKPGIVAYGEKEIRKDLELGAVDVLLLSETVDDEMIEELEKEAEKTGAKVEIISTETREGVQLREIGGMAAILRYEVNG
jgi:peptide chain release factor subunit 1